MSPAPRPPTVVTLSREEMKTRALAFAKAWAGPQREEAEAKTFLDQFFAVFGRDRRAFDARPSLADLHDPLAMPADWLKAHQTLGRTVDKGYRSAAFTSDRERVEFPFARYEALTAQLASAAKPQRGRRLAGP